MKLIRKISVGVDYKNSMHFVVGQEVLDKTYNIDYIRENKGNTEIWIKKANELVLWKSFSTSVPIVTEYNIDF